MGLIQTAKPGHTNSDAVWSYAQIVENADKVKAMLAKRGVNLNPQSALATIFRKAEVLSIEWTAADQSEGWQDRLHSAAYAIQISEAMLEAESDAAAQECLRRIAKRDMNLGKRVASQGKDALWELQLLSYLRRHGILAMMAEPDILAPMSWGDYPIACKKINSENGVEGQIRKARGQLAKFDGNGIIALNIDELTPENKLFSWASTEMAGAELSKFLQAFVDRHRDAMQNAVMKQQCDGFVLSVSVLADLESSRPRFNYQTEMMMWNLSDGPAASRVRFRDVAATVFGSVGLKV